MDASTPFPSATETVKDVAVLYSRYLKEDIIESHDEETWLDLVTDPEGNPHDLIDANMPLFRAFTEAMGREPEGDSDNARMNIIIAVAEKNLYFECAG